MLNDTSPMTTAFLVLLLINLPQGKPCTPQLATLTTGSHSGISKLPFWRKAEAGPWKGEGWLGWSHDGDALQPVRLKLTDLPRRSADDDDEVTVDAAPKVDYAVRCLPAIRPGRLAVGRRHFDNHPVVNDSLLSDSLLPDRRLGITLADRKYEVRLEATNESLDDAKVVLSDGRQTQVLYSVDGYADEPHFDVHWAGDLDRDGKLDLVVNLSGKYSLHPYRLLLSSKARPGQLVGEAATFLTGD